MDGNFLRFWICGNKITVLKLAATDLDVHVVGITHARHIPLVYREVEEHCIMKTGWFCMLRFEVHELILPLEVPSLSCPVLYVQICSSWSSANHGWHNREKFLLVALWWFVPLQKKKKKRQSIIYHYHWRSITKVKVLHPKSGKWSCSYTHGLQNHWAEVSMSASLPR